MPNRDDSNFFSEEEYDEDFDEEEDEEDGGEDVGGEDFDEEENEQRFLTKNESLHIMELDHLDNRLHKETNVAILKEAKEIAQKSFFWYFRTTYSKTQKILHVYYELIDHVNFDKNSME